MNYHMSFPIPSLTSNLCEVRAPHKGLPLGCEAIGVCLLARPRPLALCLARPPTPSSHAYLAHRSVSLLSLDPPEPLNVDKTS